jgi:hypothetical protein
MNRMGDYSMKILFCHRITGARRDGEKNTAGQKSSGLFASRTVLLGTQRVNRLCQYHFTKKHISVTLVSVRFIIYIIYIMFHDTI